MKPEQTEKVTLEFKYFIKMAINKKMTWSTLEHLLTDLATNPIKSKQIIKTLLQELLKWVSKVEIGESQDKYHDDEGKKTKKIIEYDDEPVENEESYKNTTGLMDKCEKITGEFFSLANSLTHFLFSSFSKIFVCLLLLFSHFIEFQKLQLSS